MYHIYPLDDLIEHDTEGTGCECCVEIDWSLGEPIATHRALDGRTDENRAMVNERFMFPNLSASYTGAFTPVTDLMDDLIAGKRWVCGACFDAKQHDRVAGKIKTPPVDTILICAQCQQVRSALIYVTQKAPKMPEQQYSLDDAIRAVDVAIAVTKAATGEEINEAISFLILAHDWLEDQK